MLDEFSKQAAAGRWHVAKISHAALHNPEALADDLDESYPLKTTRKTEGGGSLEVPVVAGHLKRGKEEEYSGATVRRLLKNAAKRKGLVIKLDEIQNLKIEGLIGEDVTAAMMRNLGDIHNGDIGAPVILLAGGLGNSETVLETFGISRIPDENVCYLDSLDRGATKAVIRDWLIWGGGVLEGHPHLPQWEKTLAAVSHGWPQHVHIYAQEAAKWLYHHGSEQIPDVPATVLDTAGVKRVRYYVKRANKLKEPYRKALANLLQQKGKQSILTEEELMSVLSGPQSHAEAEKMFEESLVHKGIIAETPDGGYIVPVPSMHDWLVDRFAQPSSSRP